MTTTISVQRIDKAYITTDDHGDFATASIHEEGSHVHLFLSDHQHAKLVSAALHNDRSALRAMLGETSAEAPKTAKVTA